MSTHPIPDIPSALEVPYSGPQQVRGPFPLQPILEESGTTDVRTQSQVIWTYLCVILQYYEDDMVAREGSLYGGKTRWPSALVLYIMAHVNPGLLEHYQVEWTSIVRSTPWLATWDHLSEEELHRFYQEPGPEVPSELELTTEDVYSRDVEDAAQQESGNQPVIPLHADEVQTRNSLGPQLQQFEDVPDSQQQQPPTEQEDPPHKFKLGADWVMVTKSKTGLGTEGAQPGNTTTELDSLDKELGKDKVKDVLGNYFLDETESTVQGLIHDNPGLTRSKSEEAMEVDFQTEPTAETQDQPMDTDQLGSSLETFQPELTGPRYTLSLVRSANPPPSPIMAKGNALLDAPDPETPGQEQSKAPGAD